MLVPELPMTDDLSLAFDSPREYLCDDLAMRISLLESHFSGGKTETLADLLQRQKLTAELLRHAHAIADAARPSNAIVNAAPPSTTGSPGLA
jgi:hypothetical protein